MASPQSALSELLEAFRAGDGVDLVRDSVRVAPQELIELEATERIGAAPYEHTEDRVTERNGHRPRMLTTKAGDVELRIPKLRKGSFFPIILEPRRRIDQALYAVVMEAYVHGISTRTVATWSKRWAAPVSRSPRCRGSAPTSTRPSARSAPGPLTTSSSPTSTWTRPTSTCATPQEGRAGGVDGRHRRHRRHRDR